MIWFETSATPGRSNFVVGDASTSTKGATTQAITFPQNSFAEPPKIVTWLNYIDETRGADRTLSVGVTDGSTTATGFTLAFNSWGNITFNMARASYIAFPASTVGVDCGIMAWNNTTGGTCTVSFPYGMFTKTPKVFVAISAFDVPLPN